MELVGPEDAALAKVGVVGPNPIARSIISLIFNDKSRAPESGARHLSAEQRRNKQVDPGKIRAVALPAFTAVRRDGNVGRVVDALLRRQAQSIWASGSWRTRVLSA